MGTDSTSYLLDGGNVVGELENNTLSATYLCGINLISRNDRTSTSFYLYNAHGDVISLTNTSGAVTKSYDYDAFGIEKNPNTADPNPFRYCGEYYDTETGKYYLRARYYDPINGRFTQADTHWNTANMIYGDNPQKINERQDALGTTLYSYRPQITAILQSGNLYVYCGNNPTKYTDPTGEVFVIDDAIFWGAVVIIGVVTAPALFKLLQKLCWDLAELATLTAEEIAWLIEWAKANNSSDSSTEQDETVPDVNYPGDNPKQAPGPDWEWRGDPEKGSWYNPETGETLRPDLDHPAPINPHWDYKPHKGGPWYRIYPDGSVVLK